MKKIFVLFSLVFLSTPVINSQEANNLWSVGASYIHSMDNANGEEYKNFQGVSVDGAYRLKIYRALNFHPDFSLYFSKYNGDLEAGYEKRYFWNEFGIGLKLPIGVHLPFREVSWDFETGPSCTIYLLQIAKYKTKSFPMTSETEAETSRAYPEYSESEIETIRNMYRRFMARWGFSIAINFWHDRLYAKVSYELTMTKYYKKPYFSHKSPKGPDVFSIGVGYNF